MTKIKRLLLVEDDAIIAQNEKVELEKYNYSVKIIHTGEKAIEYIKKNKVDLILMDIELGSGLDGTQTAEFILKDKDIPILFLSSHSDRKTVQKTEKITSYGYVVKGCDITILDASIKMAFRLFHSKIKESEKESQLSLQASLLQQVCNAVITVDFNNVILSWNKHAEILYQWSTEEAVGKNIIELLSPVEMKTNVYKNIETINRDGHWEGEFDVKRKDGTTIPTHIVNTHLKDKNGNNIGIIEISNDITEIKKAENKIHKTQNLYKAILNNSPNAVYGSTLDGKLLIVNDVSCKSTLYSRKELLSMNASDIDVGIINNNHRKKYWESLKFGQQISINNIMHKRKNGSTYPVNVSVTKVEVNGETIILGFAQDITDIKESNKKYRTLFDNAGDAIIIHDLKAKILAVNKKTCQQYGYTESELLSMKVSQLDTKEHSPKASERIAKLMKEGSIKFETEHNCKDGKILTLDVSSTRIMWENKPAMLSICRDITERKQLEIEKSALNEKLDGFMQSATEGFVLFDSKLNYISINKAAAQMTGFSEKHLIGKNILEVFPNIKKEGRYEAYIGVIKTGEPIYFNDIAAHPRYGQKWIEIRAFKVGNGMGMIFNDITERKHAQHNLILKNKVFNTSLAANSITDKEGNITEVNNAFLKIWGYPDKSEVVGKPIADFLQDTTISIEIINSLKKNDKWEGEYIAKKKDGTTFIGYGLTTTLKDEFHNIVGYQSSVIDITNRRQTEIELIKSNIQNKNLLSELQHRAKNSFTLINSMISIEAHSSENEDITRALNNIKSRTTAISEMYSLMHSTDSVTDIQVDKYINKIIRAIPKGLCALDTTKIKNIGKIPVKTGIPLGLILNELITNAVKYAFPGKKSGIITISLTKNGKIAKLEIKDNGIGTKTPAKNSGSMGLTLVKSLASQINGTFKIKSDKGTRCTLEFPLEKIAAEK